VLAFIEEWELLARTGSPPRDDAALAERTGVPVELVRARRRRFERVFPGERDPSRVVELLARHLPGAPFVRSLALRVVDRDGQAPDSSIVARVTVERELPRDGKWLVTDRYGIHSKHRTRNEAVAAARAIARDAGAELHIHDASGRLQETTVVRQPVFAPASAPPRDGDVDAVWRTPSGTAIVIEFKSTNWDALAEEQILPNAHRHARTLVEAAARQAVAEQVGAAVLQYRVRPSTPGRARQVEDAVAALGCTVVWADAHPDGGLDARVDGSR
jgi:hypothetical protein